MASSGGRSVSIWGVPRVPAAAVPRPSLTARIDAPVPLVVVSGFAGSGKTTLLAQWGNATARDGVWIALADAETTAGTLVQLVAQALADSGRLPAENPLAMAAEAMAGGAEPWSLLRRGLQLRGGDTVVVVDRAELLAADAAAGLVDTLVRLPGLHVVAATRSSGALTAEATAIAVDRTLLGPADLALDADQVAAVVGVGTDDPVVAAIVEAGGSAHVARAVSLTPEVNGTGAERLARAVDAFDSYLWDAHGGGVWDDAFADFLTATAVAESLTADLAAELSGDADAAALLRRAEAEGLGLVAETALGPRFSYSPLVREVLLRAGERTRPERVATLHRTVALWSLDDASYFAAIRHAVAAGDLALASTVARRSYYFLLRNHGVQLRELFADTPLLALRKYPLLAMMLALHYNAAKVHRTRALELFAIAITSARLQRATAAPADRAVLRTVESSALRVMGRFDGALSAAEDAHTVLRALDDAGRASLGRLIPILYTHIGTSYFYGGRTAEALACFRESYAEALLIDSPAGLEGLAMQAGTLAVSGDIVDAEEICRIAEGHRWPDGWLDGYMGSFLQIARALVALERNDADTAERHIRLLDRHRATIEHWPLLAHIDAVIRMLRNQAGEGLLEFETTVRHHRSRSSLGPFTSARLRATRSLLQLAAGDPAAAEHSVLRGTRRTVRDEVALARIELSRSEPVAALRLLDSTRRSPGKSSRVEGEERMLRAAALAAAGERAAALGALDDALAYLAERGQGLAIAMLPTADRRRLVDVARTAGRDDLAARVERFGVADVIPAVDARPRLSPRELAVAEQLVTPRSVAEIAAALNVSPNTVKSQLRSIYKKLGVTTRDEATAKITGGML